MPTLTNIIVTAYCACRICCGPTAPSPTASGVWPRGQHTIAAPRGIPMGTQVVIGTITYTVEDRMSTRYPTRWDIFMPTHSAALQWGKRVTNITIHTPTPPRK